MERQGKLAAARLLSLALDRRRIDPGELDRVPMGRLCIIRQHNQMGDMLAAVPAFRGLRRRFPEARITLVAAAVNSEVASRNPYVDEVLTYAKGRNARNPLALVSFIRELRSRRFDAVIVLSTFSFSVTSMLLAAASGARLRIGSTSEPFGHDLSSRFYHLELPLPPRDDVERMHESEHNLYPLAAIGVKERDLSSHLSLRPDEEAACERFLAAAVGAGAPFVVVHPGAGKRANVWPADRFARAARILRERRGFAVVAVRGPVDGEAMDAFLASSARPEAVLSSPGIGLLGALLSRAELVLCNDTGIMHIAGAVGARCVVVFGPTEPRRWKPPADSVVAVRAEDARVESVAVEDVMAAADRVLSAGRTGGRRASGLTAG